MSFLGGGTSGSGVGLSDVLTTLKLGVQAINTVASSIKSSFLQTGSVQTVAVGGTATALPPAPAGYFTVTVDGSPQLVAFYNAPPAAPTP